MPGPDGRECGEGGVVGFGEGAVLFVGVLIPARLTIFRYVTGCPIM
jgi:hypothetical protein